MPKVDEDGNDVAGIRLPAVRVPIGTFTGWNLRPRGLAEGELAGLLGSFTLCKNKGATATRPAIHGHPSKNATKPATTTFGNSAAPRGDSSSNATYWRKTPSE